MSLYEIAITIMLFGAVLTGWSVLYWIHRQEKREKSAKH